MPISQEIFDQLNTIFGSEPFPYRSPDFPDVELNLEVWAWSIPNNIIFKVKELIQEERKRVVKTGADPDITALMARFPSSIQDILSTSNRLSQEEIYALYPDTPRQKVNEFLLIGIERAISMALHHQGSFAKEESAPISSAQIVLKDSKLPHYTSLSHLVVINSEDTFDILRVEQTDGANYGLDTKAIIDKLSVWQQLYGLQIIRASSTSVTIKFDKVPRNSKKLIAELLEFCPDLYEINHRNLKEQLELWWD